MQYVVLVAMAIFFGFAFEQFYGETIVRSPGGVRAFPILSFAGAALYLVEPTYAAAFIAGLVVLGGWLYADVKQRMAVDEEPGHGYLMVPACTMAAYVLGGVAMSQPTWFTIALTVAAVLLIGSRDRLHSIAERVPFHELLTLGQFLLVVGVVLPLLYRAPAIPYTTLTPFKVWLGVVAVSALSYVSYLLDRYILRERGTLLSAVLGGMYSSTATTIVLARMASTSGYSRELASGTVVATAMMYVRILVEVAIFNAALGRFLAAPMLALSLFAFVLAAVVWRVSRSADVAAQYPSNPLALGTALGFALLLIVFSQISHWATAHLGVAGLLDVAALVGITEVDPFVIALAQSQTIAIAAAAGAIVLTTATNNVMKAAVAAIVSRHRESAVPAAALGMLAVAGGIVTWVIVR